MLMTVLKRWYQRHFSNPQIVSLFFTLLVSALMVAMLSYTLMPLLVSIVITYLLHTLVAAMRRRNIPHFWAVMLAYALFLGIVLTLLLVLLPILSQQFIHMVSELPYMFAQGQLFLQNFVQQHPDWSPLHLLIRNMSDMQGLLVRMGHLLLSYSLTSISNLMQWVVYLILVPLLVFFLLKDRSALVAWLHPYWPKHRKLVKQVMIQMDQKIGRYIQGRIIEMLLVGGVTTAAAILMKLPYAVLVGTLVGLSVLIPIVGAVVVSLFVVVIAFLAWGLTAPFIRFMIVYAVIILLDANLLVPLLFAEAMDLHPIAVIIAILFFGALWGFWGLFFAIPLATLIKVILDAWQSELS